MRLTRFLGGLGCSAVLAMNLGCNSGGKGPEPPPKAEPAGPAPTAVKGSATHEKPLVDNGDPREVTLMTEPVAAQPVPKFAEKGLAWLAKAQHPDGGWGAGSHANQAEKDPHKVQVDPATTAFTACAFLRAGHTPSEGMYKENVRRAAAYLVEVVEKAPTDGPNITDLTGTQIQSKLGATIDTAMAMQFFVRVLPLLAKGDALRDGVNRAVDKCLAKIQKSQSADGSWAGGSGWAPVLQASLNCSSLEMAQAAGKQIDERALTKARDFQKGNVNAESGRGDASKGGAGVELYAYSGGQRASAGEARAAQEWVEQAKVDGKLAKDAPVNEENLKKAMAESISAAAPQVAQKARVLADAYKRTEATAKRLDDEQLLSGFGNNGGEEFLSYMLTSESLVITGGENWTKWNAKMHERLHKIQSEDGSWSGHHCITSPVFCTAAVVQCVTTDRDAGQLLRIAEQAAKLKPATP